MVTTPRSTVPCPCEALLPVSRGTLGHRLCPPNHGAETRLSRSLSSPNPHARTAVSSRTRDTSTAVKHLYPRSPCRPGRQGQQLIFQDAAPSPAFADKSIFGCVTSSLNFPSTRLFLAETLVTYSSSSGSSAPLIGGAFSRWNTASGPRT